MRRGPRGAPGIRGGVGESAVSVRIGANPIGWSNDDLRELGGATPLETCLSEARAAGFEGMELGHKFPRQPDALRATLARFGLALVSGWYSASLLTRSVEDELAALQPHLDLLKAMGCAVLVFAETSNAVHGERATPLDQRPRRSPMRSATSRPLRVLPGEHRSTGRWCRWFHPLDRQTAVTPRSLAHSRPASARAPRR